MIGRRLAQVLGADGYDVVILSRNPEERCQQLPSGVRAVQWDGKTPKGWSHLLDHPDTYIINMAGHSIAARRWTPEHKKRVTESRVDSTRALVTAIQQAEHKPRVLIQASAVGYYGHGGDTLLTEDSPASSEWRAQVCVDWEQAVQGAGIRTAILRIGIALSLHHGALPAFILAAKLMGAKLGNGKQWVPWVHNDDVVEAIRFLMLHDEAEGVFNVVAPEPLTNADFMRTLAHVKGRPAMFTVPAWALYWALGEQALFILDSQRAQPKRLLEAGFTFDYPDAESALRDILKTAEHWKDNT